MPQILFRIRIILAIACLALVAVACTTALEPEVESPSVEPVTQISSVNQLIELADNSSPPISDLYLIQAMELMLQQGQVEAIVTLLNRVSSVETLAGSQQTRLALIRSELALMTDDLDAAIELLTGPLVSGLDQLSDDLQAQVYRTRASAFNAANQPSDALRELINLNSVLAPNRLQDVQDLIWRTLQRLNNDNLASIAATADSYELRGWIELARLNRLEQSSIRNQIEAIARWRSIWTSHSANDLVPQGLLDLELVWEQRPKNIALLLPVRDQVGIAVQEGFLSAYYEALDMGNEVPGISVFDTTGVTEIAGIYDTAVQSGADLIIGPLNKALVQQLNNFSELPVTTLALNYTDLPTNPHANLFQFGLAPIDEIALVANMAWNRGFRNAAVVSPDGINYQQLQQQFANYWRNLGGELVSSSSFSSDSEYADLIKELLAIDASESRAARIIDLLPRNQVEFEPRRRQDIDFIFLMANPRQGRQIKPTLAFYFAEEIPVYALPAIYDGIANDILNRDLNGIIFPDTPWVLDNDNQLKLQVSQTFRSAQGPLQRLRALGIDSFRLYPRLTQFASNDLAMLAGMTGTLTFSDNGSIRRIPQSAMFVDGLAIEYKPDSSLNDD